MHSNTYIQRKVPKFRNSVYRLPTVIHHKADWFVFEAKVNAFTEQMWPPRPQLRDLRPFFKVSPLGS